MSGRVVNKELVGSPEGVSTSIILCSIFQMMSVSDFGTMLAHLIRVCWSASAGQLHLASTEASPSPSSPSGGEDSKVRTFICVDQENDAVSSKV